jgi:hypothetical protein
MNVKKVRFYVLDVGQGACNYVEIVDKADKVIHNMLIDLGTNSKQTIADANIKWLTDRIKAKGRDNPRIDVLIITHGDTDHYNLMLKLLPALNPASKDRIGMVRYGGVEWRYKIGSTSLIKELKKYSDDVEGLTASQSGYKKLKPKNKWEPIWPDKPDDADPKLQLLIANTPHPKDNTIATTVKRPNAEAINSKSVVTAIEWDNHWIVATGDATATTLEAINTLLENEDTLPTTFMMTLPHHGSRKTTYDLRRANNVPGDAALQVVDDLLGKFKPKTVSISADEKSHHHPSMLMIEQFSKYTDKKEYYWKDPAAGSDRHFLTAWIDKTLTATGTVPAWPPSFLYATTQTKAPIFSTLYFDTVQYNGNKYGRYISPPIPAIPSGGGPLAKGIPRGRNFEFIMDSTEINVDSTPNVHPTSSRRVVFPAIPPPVGSSRAAPAASTPRAAAKTGAELPVFLRAPAPTTSSGTATHPVAAAPTRLRSLKVIL